ncbi:coiled-coil protein [Legionella birminghamensis]|uniref:Coiled-coil protein n=1 Tax=Legionella birminghamensis TaxID=28083 RepID=A0A378I5B9_9GAMM|nr:primosomal replication protein PriC [Legionella birminghamensis]KTC70213.1 coiled-coil protein [Legionella birminghamensis]STX30379.1 coiled-coil protein [Legionella birminghamensis]
MVENIETMLLSLKARLPELAWNLNKPGAQIPWQNLPPGIFRYQFEPKASDYIAEIKSDIERLEQQVNTQAASYLAQRIQQKINILVRLCRCKPPVQKADNSASFMLQALSTRQQWLASLEEQIQSFTEQRDALAARLSTIAKEQQLAVLAELGAAEKRLTEAKEAYAKAIER